MKFFVRFIIFFFIFFLFYSLVRNILDYQNKLAFYQDYKKEYEKEKKRNITLQTEALKKSSYSELERTIRNKLNLLKPDEVAIMLPTPTPTPPNIIPTPAPNWRQWWNIFFKTQ